MSIIVPEISSFAFTPGDTQTISVSDISIDVFDQMSIVFGQTNRESFGQKIYNPRDIPKPENSILSEYWKTMNFVALPLIINFAKTTLDVDFQKYYSSTFSVSLLYENNKTPVPLVPFTISGQNTFSNNVTIPVAVLNQSSVSATFIDVFIALSYIEVDPGESVILDAIQKQSTFINPTVLATKMFTTAETPNKPTRYLVFINFYTDTSDTNRYFVTNSVTSKKEPSVETLPSIPNGKFIGSVALYYIQPLTTPDTASITVFPSSFAPPIFQSTSRALIAGSFIPN
jgi:hypothetical protein